MCLSRCPVVWQDYSSYNKCSQNLQIKKVTHLSGGSEFVAYPGRVDEVDGVSCLIDWKTTTSRYPEAPEGLLSLDPNSFVIRGSAGSPKPRLLSLYRSSGTSVFEGHDFRRAMDASRAMLGPSCRKVALLTAIFAFL